MCLLECLCKDVYDIALSGMFEISAEVAASQIACFVHDSQSVVRS